MSLITGLMNSVGVMPNIQALVAARTKAVPIFKVLLREPEIKDNENSKTSYTLEKGIKFENVFFRYPVMPEGSPDVLQGVNFTIKSKTSTAIVGPSGSGKSTIVQMVERFYDPKSGNIYMDGEDIKRIKLSTLRESIGYVSQEPVLIMGTIRQNLAFGWCSATEEEMKEALKQANALDFVLKLEGGLDAYVGASSMLNLSGGQKQRIAIARALLRKPKILILDEATSALDTKSEDEVQRAIDKIQIENKDLTVIVIAHRLTTIEASDNIIFLEAKNKAVEAAKGTPEYDQVMEKLKAENYAHQKQEEEDEEDDEEGFDFDMPRIQAGSSKKGRSIKGFRKGSRGIQEREEEEKKKKEEEEKKKKEEEEAKKKQGEVKRVVSMGEIMKYYEPTWVLILSFVFPAISSLQFPMFGLIFTRILFIIMQPYRDDFYSELNEWTGYFLCICVLMGTGGMLTKIIYTKGGEKCTYNIRERVFESILYKHVWWFDTQETSAGVISNVLSEKMSKINGMTTESISVILEAFLTIAIGILVACIYSWPVALVTLAISPMQILGTFAMAKLQWRRGEEEDAYKRSNALLSEIIMNYRTIVGFGAKNIDAIMDEYRSHIYLPNRGAVKKAHVSGFFFGYSQYAKFGMIGIIFHLATILMFEYDLNQLDVYTAVYVIFISSVGTGFNLSQQQNVTEAKVAASIVFDIIDEPSKVDARKQGEVKEVKKGLIEFKDVEFKYPSRDTMVLQKINFKIQDGQSIALVGASGSGKSTIASLLLQFYQQQSGQILIDGVDIKDYDISALRKQIGYVMQEPVLFNDTIKNNILYGKLEASDEEVWQASQQANALQFIESNIENLQGEKALENQKKLVEEATQNLGQIFKELGKEVNARDNLLEIRLFYEIVTKGDEKSKHFIEENKDLFTKELQEKVNISGFKWDDFVMRFEWTVREYIPVLKLLENEKTLKPEVKEGLIKAVDANPEKLDFELVESFVELLNSEEKSDESTQEVIKRFISAIFEDQKKQGGIKFRRFTELSDNLTKTFSGKALHEGFEKSCGLKGSQLSGGQKQRIAIARALIKKPKMLILDEATSALDEHSQEIVQQALDRAMEGRTSIVIAHRLSTIRNCNLIFVVNEGKIIEIGTFKELSNKKGGHFAGLKSRMEN